MSEILDIKQVCEICLREINSDTHAHATHANLCERCGKEVDAIENIRHVLRYITQPRHLHACPICGTNLMHIGMREDAYCQKCHLWFLQGNTNARDHTQDYIEMQYNDGHVLRYDAGSHAPFFDKVPTVAEVTYSKWALRDFYTFEEYQAGVYRDNTSARKSEILDERSENQKRLDKLGI